MSSTENLAGSSGDTSKSDESESDTDSYYSDTEWPDVDIPGSWGKCELEGDAWDDNKKPVVRFRKYEDIILNEEELQGILSERIVAACSSYLDRCPEIGKYVLCKCDLSRKNLRDISVLTYHHYLQYLDLSGNRLESLEPLGQLPFLMHLNASHNELKDVLNFKPPFNLTHVNYSHNSVKCISDLSMFRLLVHLDLSYNEIYYITGLEDLKYLQELDLSCNSIMAIENLNHMSLTHLNLEQNNISAFAIGENIGLKTLKHITAVNLSHNAIKSLKLFEEVYSIQEIYMQDNMLRDLIQLNYLRNLSYLTEVDFRNNPMTNVDKYYETCISIIRPIRVIDTCVIDANAKVLARNRYEPIPAMESASKHAKLLLLQQLNNFNVNHIVRQLDENIPSLIVLVGPPGCGQGGVVQDFYKKHQKYLKLGVSHTTRPKNQDDIEGVSYYFVSEEQFRDLMQKGVFLNVSEFIGYTYGFSQEELGKIRDGDHVLITHTDLSGAINLKLNHLFPKLVLTLTSDREKYYARLIHRYYCRHKRMSRGNLIRILNDPLQAERRTDESDTSSLFSAIENILSDILSNIETEEDDVEEETLKEEEGGRDEYDDVGQKVTVRFYERSGSGSSDITASSSSSDYIVPNISDQPESILKSNVDSFTDKQNSKSQTVSFVNDFGQDFRSVSEATFDAEQILSVLSGPNLQEDEDSFPKLNSGSTNRHEEVQKLLKKIAATRNMYVEFHHNNPGFFCETIYSDHHADALQKLSNILKDVISRPIKPYGAYLESCDTDCDEMLAIRLRDLHEEIYKDMSVSQSSGRT